MSIVRRAGSQLLRMIERAADPAAEALRVLLYGKNNGVTTQLFARTPDGNVYQLTPNGMLDPAFSSFYFDDFIGIQFSTLAVTGAGSNSLGMASGAGHPGTYLQGVTAAGVDSARITFGGNSFFFGGGAVTYMYNGSLTTLSNGVDNIVQRIGFGDSTTVADHVDGYYLEYDFATHGNHNYRLCASLNSVRTKVDTGIVAVAGASRAVRLFMNPAGTLGSCTIDGVAGANTVAANIPVSVARATHLQIQSVKQLGAGLLQAVHDYHGFRVDLTTAR